MDISPLLPLQETAENTPMSEQEYRSYNQRIHTEIWKHSGNRKLYDLLVSMWNGPSASVAGRDSAHETQSIREHRLLLDAIGAQDISTARMVMADHLERSMQNILGSFLAAHPEDK